MFSVLGFSDISKEQHSLLRSPAICSFCWLLVVKQWQHFYLKTIALETLLLCLRKATGMGTIEVRDALVPWNALFMGRLLFGNTEFHVQQQLFAVQLALACNKSKYSLILTGEIRKENRRLVHRLIVDTTNHSYVSTLATACVITLEVDLVY